MESEDKKPIFTKRLILTVLAIILIILIILLLLRRCGNGNGNHNVTGVTVSPLYMTLAPGESQLLQAYVEPSDATNQKITCSSNNPEVASVDPDTCLVHGISEGTAEITATSEDGGKTASCTVTVTKKPSGLTGIELSAGTYKVKKGKSKLVSVSPTPHDAQLPDLVYSMADESIATVNQNGVIKGVEVGTTTLVVRSADGQYSAMATVKVYKDDGGPKECPAGQVLVDGKCVDDITEKPKPTKIDINGSKDVTLSVGDTYIIPFTITPSDAEQEAICTVTGTSGIVSESNCTLTALAKGTTTVKVCAKADTNICDTMKVTVKSGGGYVPPGPSKPPKPTEPSCPGCPTEVEVGEGVITIKAVTTAGNDKWHRSGKFVITVAGRITDIQRITYSTSDSAGVGKTQSGTLTSGVKTIYLDDTPGTASVTVKYTYQGKEYSISNSITKIDSKNPTCSSFKYDSGLKKIVVNASDEMSGLKNAVFSGNSVNFTGVGSATYPISSTGKYSVLIYDVAGNSTSCGSVNITDLNKDVDGKSGAIPLKLEVSTNKLDLNLNESKSVKAWLLMSDNTHKPVNLCKSNSPEYVECSSGGSDGSGNGNISIKGKQEGKSMTVTVWAGPAWVEMAGGKELSATITVNVGASQKPSISMSRNYGSGSDKGGWTLNVTAKANNPNEVVTEVAFGYSKDGAACKTTDKRSSDVPEAKVGFSVNLGENYIGKWTACASMKTSKGLTAEVSYTYDADSKGPSCDVRKYGKNMFIITASDNGKGIRYVKADGRTLKTLASGINSVTVTSSTKKNVVAIDWSGNTTKCTDNTGTDEPTSVKVTCTKYTFEGVDPDYNKSKCTAYVEPATADQQVKWDSSSNYVKVDAYGNVSQTKQNKTEDNIAAVITATTSNGKSGNATIMVSPGDLMDNSKVPTCSVTANSKSIEVGQSTYVSINCSANGSTSFKRAYDKPTYILTNLKDDGKTGSVVTLGGNLCQSGYCGGSTYFSATFTVTGVNPGYATISVPSGLYVNPSGHENKGASVSIRVSKPSSELKPEIGYSQTPEATATGWVREGKAVVSITDDKAGVGYNLRFNGANRSASSLAASSSITYSVLKNGTVTVTGTVTDADGNSVPVSHTYTFNNIDRIAPTCSITAAKSGSGYVLTATASDAESGLQTEMPAGWNGGSGRYTQYQDAAGTYSFTISDVAGNTHTCRITPDKFPAGTRAPSANITVSGTDALSTLLGIQPTMTVRASDDTTNFKVQVTGSLTANATVTTGTTWAKTFDLTQNKTYSGTVVVTDADGLTDTKTYNFTISNAGKAPQCSGRASKSTLNIGETTTVTFSCTLPSGSGGAITRVASTPSVGSGLSMPGVPAYTNSSITVTVKAIAAGTTSVSIPAGAFKNGSRNSNATSVAITVNAPAAPICSISGAGSISVTSGQTATVNFNCSIPGGSGSLTRNISSVSSAVNCSGCSVVGGGVGASGTVTAVVQASSGSTTASVSLKSGVYKNGTSTSSGTGSVSIKWVPKTAITCGSLSYSVDKRVAYFGAKVTNLKAGETVSRTISSANATCSAASSSISCSSKRDGSYTLTVKVTNSTGGTVASASCPYTVSGIVTANPAVVITGSTSISSARGTTSLTASTTNPPSTGVAYYTWTSTNTSCATVPLRGTTVTVTGVNTSSSRCTTTITASAVGPSGGGVATKSVTVTVAANVVPKLTISGSNPDTATDSKTFSALLSGASASKYSWSSSNTRCATVGGISSSTTLKGVNTSTSGCTTVITAKALDASGNTIATATKTVSVPGKTGLTATLTISGSAPSTATGTSSISALLSGGTASKYSWSSSDTSCATAGGISSSTSLVGKNTKTAACTTTITAKALDASGNIVAQNSKTFTIPGTSGSTASLVVSGGNPTTATGTTTLGATVSGVSGVAYYVWTSSNTSCATVSGSSGSTTTITGKNTSTTSTCTTTITCYAKRADGTTLVQGTKTITVPKAGALAENFACGTIAGANTKWTNSRPTVKVTCLGADCASTQPAAQYTPTAGTTVKTYTLKIYSKKGASKDCVANVYYDGVAPTCKYGDAANTVWKNTNHTLQIICSDSGSGCQTGGLGTRNVTITTNQTTVNHTVGDVAGNTTKCGAHAVYTDFTAPSLTCTATNGTSGVTVKRVFSDAFSGIKLSSGTVAAGVSTTLTDTYSTASTKTFTATDLAGNRKSCTVKITVTTTDVCPAGTVAYGSRCRKTSGGTAATSCSGAGYNYNSSTGKCEYTKTTSKSGTSGPTCAGETVASGYTCSTSNVNFSGGVFTWKCNCVTSAMSPSCPSGKIAVSGTCYDLVNKTTQTTYGSTVSY